MSEWISVKDRLPDIGQQVWINFMWPEGYMGQGYAIWNDYEGKPDWFWDVDENGTLLSRQHALDSGAKPAEVTHWQPLPHPPKA